MTVSRTETSTPAGRLRLLTLLVANPAESHLDADTLPWVADRLRSDLPLLLELHSAVVRGDERRALELVNQLDGEQGDSDE